MSLVLPVAAYTISGSDGGDTIYGTNGIDILEGFAGDDVIFGYGGDDQILGGSGMDIAVYTGPMAGYVFSNTVCNTFSISDANPVNGDEGTDSLAGIETVRFTDGDIQVSQLCEFQVSSDGLDPATAVLTDGSFVITWTAGDGSNSGIFAQRYAADGTLLGASFRVNTTYWLTQEYSDVAALPNGGFLVVWSSDVQDLSGSGVFGQRFDANGVKVGGEFQINTYTQADQEVPAIAVFDNGGFVVVWHSYGQDGDNWGVYGQRYDANGVKTGAEFQVNQTTTDMQARPQLASLVNNGVADGGFVVTWVSGNAHQGTSDAYGRVFGADGLPQDNEFLINTFTYSDQGCPTVSALENGGFVAVLHSQDVDGPLDPDGDGYGIFARLFTANGTKVGGEFQVNTTTAGPQSIPNISTLSDGSFVVVWISGYYYSPGSEYQTDIYGQRFDADGNPVGGEFRINTYGTYDQQWPDLAALPDGGFVVTWENTQEGTVYAKRFDADGNPVNELTLTGTVGDDTLWVGEGTQILKGGLGNDIYIIDMAEDEIDEGANAGIDTVFCPVTYALPSNLENLHLTEEGLVSGMGNDLANALTGNVSANNLYGLSGNDTLLGGEGDDRLDGGTGLDTAVYAGNLSGFHITRTQDIAMVEDRMGSEGLDTLFDIERLQFTDMSVNLTVQAAAAGLDTPALERLEELYVAFFNRVPDADGLEYWIGEFKGGQTIEQIAESFYNAGILYSDLTGYSPSMTNADFVNTVYRNVLGREDGADPEGLDYWTTQLASGAETRGSLVSTILDSAHTFKGDPTWGWVADLLDNKIVVADTFAVEWGLNFNTPEDSIAHGMAIAEAVTPTDTSAAIALIGITEGQIDLA